MTGDRRRLNNPQITWQAADKDHTRELEKDLWFYGETHRFEVFVEGENSFQSFTLHN